MMIHYAETEYGFEYGAAKVTRITSDKKRKWIVLGIETPKTRLQVYVTKTGKVRVHSEGAEWFPENTPPGGKG